MRLGLLYFAITYYNKAKQISDSLLSRYSLPSASRYYSEIDYSTYDPSGDVDGVFKLIAKGFKRYGYDCSGAIGSIENEAQENSDNFKEDFNAQIQDEILSAIVEPIQDLLPQLRDALNGTD